MSRQGRIHEIARRAQSEGIAPAAAVRDEAELHFVRSHSGAIWDAIAAQRAKDPEQETGADSDPMEFEKCEKCDGTGMLDVEFAIRATVRAMRTISSRNTPRMSLNA